MEAPNVSLDPACFHFTQPLTTHHCTCSTALPLELVCRPRATAVNECGFVLLPMRRKLSSSAEEDNEGSTANHPQPNHDEKKTTFSTAKYDLTRHSDTLDRRKVEKALAPAQLTPSACTPPAKPSSSPKKSEGLPAGQTRDKMLDARARQNLRIRSPWSCSLLTLTTTLSAFSLMLYILHSFATRQLDSKGCDMYYTSSMFYRFADFDTEHTRFASKYSLHLYREIGYDEDYKVPRFCNLLKMRQGGLTTLGQRCSSAVHSG